MAEWWNEDAKLVLPLETYSPGTYLSDLLWPEPGTLEQFQINVWVSAVTGLAPAWVSSLETSTDGTTWTTVPGSETPTLNAVGSVSSNAQAPPDTYTRIRTVISGGVAVTMTGRAYITATPPLI